MTPEEYPVEHSFDIQAILIREDLIAELKRRVAELEEKNADLEAGLGHEQVVTMQNREARLQGYIRDLGAQVTALKEIAEEERAAMLACAEDLHGIDEGHLIEACRQLAEEHPEAFR